MAPLSGENTIPWMSLGAKVPGPSKLVCRLQSQYKHLNNVSNVRMVSIHGTHALPEIPCVRNASGKDTLVHRANQRQCLNYNLMRAIMTTSS